MQLRLLTPEESANAAKKLVAFAVRYGDNRLTAAGLNELRKLAALGSRDVRPLEPLGLAAPDDRAAGLAAAQAASSPPAAIAVALEGGKIAAFAFAADAGERACLVVVRPERRGGGLGSMLLRALRSRCGKLACHVATDNPASMQMCFRAGMKAVGLRTGPTGKPTLRFEC
jgi:GNAT superfamily N-acetyltransferase